MVFSLDFRNIIVTKYIYLHHFKPNVYKMEILMFHGVIDQFSPIMLRRKVHSLTYRPEWMSILLKVIRNVTGNESWLVPLRKK